MENNVSGNNPGTQNSGNQEPRYRDWCAEKHAWKEEHRAWRRERREAFWPFRHMFWGLVLILLGVLFLVGASHWWPIALLVAGVCYIGRFIWHANHADNKAQ